MTLTFGTLTAFALVAALLVMSPGPNGVLVAKTMSSSGSRSAFANIIGFVLAFYFHGLMVVLGLSALVMKSANLFAVVKIIGALYLAWLGIKALKEALGPGVSQDGITPHRNARKFGAALAEGFATNALNPKVAMFYLAALPQFVSINDASATRNILVLVFIHSMISFLWFSIWVLAFSKLATAVRSQALIRALKGITGMVFLGFGLRLATLQR